MRPPIAFQPGWPMYTALMYGFPMQATDQADDAVGSEDAGGG